MPPTFRPNFWRGKKIAIEYGRTIGLLPEVLLGTGWPFGGPYIPAEMGAGQLKFYSLEITGPSIYSGPVPGQAVPPERLLTVQAIQVGYDGAVLLDTLQDLTGRVSNWVLTEWAIPPGKWLLMTFVRGYAGMKVKRASPGGEGLVLDHFSREAFELHLRKNAEVQLPYIQKAQGVTMDSWESLDLTGHQNCLRSLSDAGDIHSFRSCPLSFVRPERQGRGS